jgi:hypothetical protein
MVEDRQAAIYRLSAIITWLTIEQGIPCGVQIPADLLFDGYR